MALGIFGFSLVILAAIGNVPLAAVSVIYADVHFCAAILTEKQARQRVDFPVPVGASDGCVFQNPLYGFKIAAADNRLMHIFCDVPLAPVYIVVMFIPEMLCSLEVDYIAAILMPCEDIGQGDFVPLAAVILVERLIFTGSPPAVFHVESGGWDLLLCQIYGDLVRGASKILGGGGGGKPDFAQGGGADATKINEALEALANQAMKG